jgi:hypothetical protein
VDSVRSLKKLIKKALTDLSRGRSLPAGVL